MTNKFGMDGGLPAAGVMYVASGKVLLLKRRPEASNGGTWCFPAGGLEANETPEQGARREFVEEVGIPLDAKLTQVWSQGGFTLFHCEGAGFTPAMNGEHTEFMWAPLTNLPEPLHPGCAEQIALVVAPSVTMDDAGGSAREEDVNGYVTILRNPISRAGVFQYLGSSIGGDAIPDKIYNVYRPPESLSDPQALDSFKLMPIIDDHVMLGPQEKGLVPAEMKGTDGTTGEQLEFCPQTNTLFSNLRIYSRSLLSKIQSGKKDLSMGYRCAYKKIAGFFNGMPYDYIQVNMRGNHLALVDEARCDVAVLDHRFTYDARDVIQTGDANMADKDANTEEKKVLTIDEVAAWAAENMPKFRELAATLKGEDEDTEIGPSGDVTMDEEKDDKKDDADKKAEDESEEKEEKAMDAKTVTRIAQDAAANAVKNVPTFADFAKEAAERDTLYTKLAPVIGAFDHKEKTLAQVAAYGVEKLGLNAKAGQEMIALDGFFAGRKVSTVGYALDAKAGAKKSKVADKISAHINA